MELEVFTYKADPDLRLALMRVAHQQSELKKERVTASAYVRALVENDPKVATELQKIKGVKPQ